MATADDNRTLSTDVANTLLEQIRASAAGTTGSGYLKDLAEAYATVVGAMPTPAPRARAL